MFNSSVIPALEQVISFSQARHEVLAGNIANLDTPGYRVRDLSVSEFQEQLAASIEQRHQASGGRETVEHPVEDPAKSAGILYHDDSDVSLEQQVAEINKNHTQHQLALTIMTSQFRLLQSAISERAG